jgi:TolB protein
MKRSLIAVAFAFIAASLAAQSQIVATVDPNQGAKVMKIAIPFPELTPPAASANASPVASEVIHAPFYSVLTRDIAASGVFAIAPIPPNIPASANLAKQIGADFALKMSVWTEHNAQTNVDDIVVEARLLDTTGGQPFGKRYRGVIASLSLMAHSISTDIVRAIYGKPGIFLSRIAFASDRTGTWEIWLMDWDGQNQRQITQHGALSILPSWSPDNERMVYTSFARGTSDMYIVNRRGGGRIRVPTNLALNTSATFSPVGNDIAFVGSVNGNPDIYLIKDDATNLRRLTSSATIESTPEWSPNGRQISFTSGRSGTPQIYVMDAEGTNVRRISFEGEWNDDAAWSPDGEQLAYTSRVNGRFQIRVMNLTDGQSRIIAGEGSNEQPAWSPDGRWIAFQSNRSGKWQLYRMRIDGNDIQQLTTTGENKEPDWSKKIE